MEFRFLSIGGSFYEEERALRFQVLRKPLGLPPGSELFEHEEQSLHLVAIDDDEVIGCVLFHSDRAKGGRLFQMAVKPGRQREGLGSKLVRELEVRLRRDGFDHIELHARDHAIPFYEQLGYVSFDEPFEEVGIPHQRMSKQLA